MNTINKVRVDYGKDGIRVNLDPSWNIDIIKPKKQEALKNPIKKIKKAIKNPINTNSLRNIVENKKDLQKICIVVSDATRPVPSNIILEALIEELNNYGITDNQITILIATGLHRRTREPEKKRILGDKLLSRIEIIDHEATDKNSLVNLGSTSDGIPIYINKHYYNSDLKILTGYVEPHFFFGFSGGRKSIVPGIVGAETIQANHSAKNISSKYARFGIYKQNPMHQNSSEICKIVGVDFIINVCINEYHQITNVIAGEVEKSHETLVEYQLNKVFFQINHLYDIVICGNGGYPLDLNLYQAVKGMAIGEMAVKEGGTIISVNELSDGVGIGQDNFRDLIFSGLKPKELYTMVKNEEILVPDQWEIQILARVLMKADIYVISELPQEELGNIGLKYASSVESAIQKALLQHGKDASILILPNGPQILPKLDKP
ncbi:MAG: nickel-dependent lactate racemase [Candidatus Lokiarchaeota archaeon]|nr:nickel-dependent lactate racemase [Candidatus Lokiarchaeota archaeon]MBD3202422.1 nickel-dependent lactate racemase [Candidatus Lokiarchaeota archaeon]